MGHSRPLFSLFSSLQQWMVNKHYILMDSNPFRLLPEATSLPAVAQPLPKLLLFLCHRLLVAKTAKKKDCTENTKGHRLALRVQSLFKFRRETIPKTVATEVLVI